MGTTSGAVAHGTLKAIADRLRERYGAERVLVYGSVARGESTVHSDIDLLVIAPTKERFYERMGSVLAVVRDISRGLPLAPMILTPDELSSRLARGDQFIQIVQIGGLVKRQRGFPLCRRLAEGSTSGLASHSCSAQ